ncbi:MAG: aminoglycoside phosphotransferase family protein [Myxococcota bacterium]
MTATSIIPQPADAIHIARHVLGQEVAWVQRFPTGLCHYVYDVKLVGGERCVVRLASREHRRDLAGGIHWSRVLRPLGVPLPRLLASNPSAEPFPYMILERLDGRDLGEVVGSMSYRRRTQLACTLARMQDLVGELPQREGYGYACTDQDDLPHRTWYAAVHSGFDRTEGWIRSVGVIDPGLVDRVRGAAADLREELLAIEPRPFLHDITTKNVLIDAQGHLAGIVDVDSLCYGDPLQTVALTRMSLLNMGGPLDYIDAWCDAMGATEEGAQHRLNLYTAGFAVAFLGELGQAFNKEAPVAVDPVARAKLEGIVTMVLDAF